MCPQAQHCGFRAYATKMMAVDCPPGAAGRRLPAGDAPFSVIKKNWFFLTKTTLEHGRAWARAVEDPQGRRPPIVYSEQLPHTLFPARPSAQSGSGAAVLSGRACAAQLEPASGSSSALLSPPAPGRRPRSVFQTKPGAGGKGEVGLGGGGGPSGRRSPGGDHHLGGNRRALWFYLSP